VGVVNLYDGTETFLETTGLNTLTNLHP